MSTPRGQAALDAKRRWAAKHPEYKRGPGNNEKVDARLAQIKAAINPCYLKEARAMLEGKNTRGRNKCVELEGDQEPTK